MMFASGFQFKVALHEALHAVGFYHEQDRSDRDLYLAQHPENAEASELIMRDICTGF